MQVDTLKKQYWNYPFVKDGLELTWRWQSSQFRDRTNLAGPRSWSGQQFPDGKAEHPVTDINWYEAAAYAAFRDKRLPTIFQWEKAARNGLFTYYSGYVMPWGPIDVTRTVDTRANFKSGGTTPVGSFEFGMSPFAATIWPATLPNGASTRQASDRFPPAPLGKTSICLPMSARFQPFTTRASWAFAVCLILRPPKAIKARCA